MCILLCNYLLLMIIIINCTCAMSLLLGCYVLFNHSYCDVIHFFLYNCMLLSSPRSSLYPSVICSCSFISVVSVQKRFIIYSLQHSPRLASKATTDVTAIM